MPGISAHLRRQLRIVDDLQYGRRQGLRGFGGNQEPTPAGFDRFGQTTYGCGNDGSAEGIGDLQSAALRTIPVRINDNAGELHKRCNFRDGNIAGIKGDGLGNAQIACQALQIIIVDKFGREAGDN